MKGRRGNPGLKGRLLEKSLQAYIIALETINKMSLAYRVEAAFMLICNAWELLLKAKILDDSRNKSAIYYPKERLKMKRTLSLTSCMNVVMLRQDDPIRRNLEKVIQLRDAAVHFEIKEWPYEVIGIFRSAVMNYHEQLFAWFERSLSDQISPGMMSIVFDNSPEDFSLSNIKLRRRLGKDAFDFLSQYCAEVKEQSVEFGELSYKFAYRIDYHIAIAKREKDADLTLSSGSLGDSTRVVEVPQNASKTHPFRQTEVVNQANAAGAFINQYDVQCIVSVYKVKRNSTFFYQGTVPGSPPQYSKEFVDWLIKKCAEGPEFIAAARQKAKEVRASLKSSEMPSR